MQQKKDPESKTPVSDIDQDAADQTGISVNSPVQEFLPALWYLLADRIAPKFCCRYPSPLQQIFQAAVREVSRDDGDLDRAVSWLHDIVTNAPAEEMIFEQAGQLLNIIEWRRMYHPSWFAPGSRGRRLKPGRCSEYISHAIVLLQTGSDKDALDLTEKILDSSEPASDDQFLVYLIRSAVFICSGEVAKGEAELARITRKNLPN
ncbi:hypothetical protein [uncultured Methanospirillum sp.]|uniref:hypothetical protein n=1 Tax=uncultured Methanospirillum sp. TaxID=262503 RepID=UPI0029C94B84|nr:hypothetical protein [uncultured Methanospirillum sp.]